MASSRPVAAELATIRVHGISREAFLVRSVLAAAAAFGTMSASALVGRALAQSRGGDVDILNFALTLEYLESTFYTLAVKEVGALSFDEQQLARRLRDDEGAHVDALTATIKQLGGQPAAKPAFDFGGAFGGRAAFLKTASTLEDTGVSAYNGAATSISSVDALAAAAGIAQIEARHAALIRLARDKTPAPQPFDKASQMEEALAAVQPFITA